MLHVAGGVGQVPFVTLVFVSCPVALTNKCKTDQSCSNLRRTGPWLSGRSVVTGSSFHSFVILSLGIPLLLSPLNV